MLIAVMLAFPVAASAQRQGTGFLNRVVVEGSETRRYQVFVPADYTSSRRWPVVLFLHGGGEQGNDGLIQTEVGLGSAIRRDAERWSAIVVFPQVRDGRPWNGQDAAWALKALEQTQREFATDPFRVYLTGMSRGGAGAYYLAYRHPTLFAAILVVCGRVRLAANRDGQPARDTDPVIPVADGDPFEALAAKLKNVPLWVFHGDADAVVPVEESRRATAALRKAGSPVIYTELAGVGHNAWDSAYRNPEVVQWLLSNRISR
ncbi:MAG: prolyl oligopeptidase family serine peptidase [Gemmatimonadetes bacterium]|nr:prolyl oligopeptidase family serine peptidase [Gemmatimonadota bacterium]